MSAWSCEHVLAGAVLPAAVQVSLLSAFPQHAAALAANPSLAAAAWDVLYSPSAPLGVLEGLLERELFFSQVERVAQDAVEGRFLDPRALLFAERALSCAFTALASQDALAVVLADVPGTLVAATVLASDAPLLVRAAAARNASSEDRLGWLTSPPAASLPDDVVWDLLALPLGRSSALVRARGAQVLLRRPALRSRAVRGPLELVKMASRVPLEVGDQEALVAALAVGDLSPGATEALVALGSAPWCTPLVRGRVVSLLGFAPSAFLGSGVDLRSAPWWRVRSLVSALASKELSDSVRPGFSWPYALFELAHNPALRGRARRRVLSLLSSPGWAHPLGEVALDLLAALGAPDLLSLEEVGAYRPLRPPSLLVRPSSPLVRPWSRSAALEVSAAPAERGALLAAFTGWSGSASAWETALVLLGDGYTGTLGELLAAAELLSSPAAAPR